MRKLAVCAAAFSLGIFLPQYVFSSSIRLYATIVFVLIGIMGAFFGGKKKRYIMAIAFSIAVGMLYFSGYDRIFMSAAKKYDGETRVITAEAVEFSQKTDYGMRAVVKMETEKSVKIKAVLYIYDENAAELCPGDKIKINARMTLADTIYGKENDTYIAKGIYLFAYQSGNGTVEVEHGRYGWIRYLPKYLAKLLDNASEEVFLEDAVNFMRAILIGSRDGLYKNEELVSDLKISGIFHIVAVSGLHTAFVVELIMLLCRKNRRIAGIVTVPILLLYMFVTGMQPSVQRAVVMQIFLLASSFVYRENDRITSISAALMLILLINPYSAKSIGLQLSFAATFGIILCSQKLYDIIICKPIQKFIEKKNVIKRIVTALAACISASLGAMVFTIPLTVIYFGYVSVISIVTNIFVIWLVPVCFGMGLIAAIIGAVCPPAGSILGFVPSVIAIVVELIATKLAHVKFASVHTVNPYIAIWLVFIYCVALISIIYKAKLRGIAVTSMLGSAALGIALLVSNISVNSTDMSVTAIDVGQGQCIIANVGDHVLMVDCGSQYENAGEIASEYMLSTGNGRIDLLVLTHFDSDHVNGFKMLASKMKITAVAMPSTGISDSDVTQSIIDTAEKHEIDIITVTDDIKVIIGEMSINLLAMSKFGTENENDSGIVVLASKDNFDLLVTGDISSTMERKLISNYDIPDTEVAVIGHHGSKYSTCEEYLDAVTPDVAIISVGYNTYKHPADEIIERLENKDITVLRTDIHGNVTVKSK